MTRLNKMTKPQLVERRTIRALLFGVLLTATFYTGKISSEEYSTIQDDLIFSFISIITAVLFINIGFIQYYIDKKTKKSKGKQ